MDEISHSSIELNVCVLEASISNLSLSNPTLDFELIAVLIIVLIVCCHEEAKTRILSKILAEFVRNVSILTSLWLMLDGPPTQFD